MRTLVVQRQVLEKLAHPPQRSHVVLERAVRHRRQLKENIYIILIFIYIYIAAERGIFIYIAAERRYLYIFTEAKTRVSGKWCGGEGV